MNIRTLIFLLLLVASALAAERAATVNGHQLTYELRGEGPPIVFLHGGGDSARYSFPSQLEEFSARHLVVAPEQTGHGRTPDTAGPLSYSRWPRTRLNYCGSLVSPGSTWSVGATGATSG